MAVEHPPSPAAAVSYWRFWWPLALVGLAMPVGRVMLNGGLARMDEGTRELATLAYAQGIYFMPQAALIFLPQVANILARSRLDHQRCRLFALVSALALVIPVLLLGGPLRPLLGQLYSIDGEILRTVGGYLLLMSPLLILDGISGYHIGLLVRHQRTGWVSVATVSNLLAVATVVLIASWAAASATTMVIAALTCGGLVQTLLVIMAWLRTAPDFSADDRPALRLSAIFAFFWPLAITSMMFAASRPTIYAVVGYSAAPLLTVAILRVAFDLGILAQLPVNQFRHLLVTFVAGDGPGVARFMLRTTATITAAVIIVVLSPLSSWILGPGLGIAEELHQPIRQAWLILTAVPVVIAWRNWYHGLSMVRRQTRGMALAGVLRVVAIAGFCWAALGMGWLNHHSGAMALVIGFAIEALIVRWMNARIMRLQPPTIAVDTRSRSAANPHV